MNKLSEGLVASDNNDDAQGSTAAARVAYSTSKIVNASSKNDLGNITYLHENHASINTASYSPFTEKKSDNITADYVLDGPIIDACDESNDLDCSIDDLESYIVTRFLDTTDCSNDSESTCLKPCEDESLLIDLSSGAEAADGRMTGCAVTTRTNDRYFPNASCTTTSAANSQSICRSNNNLPEEVEGLGWEQDFPAMPSVSDDRCGDLMSEESASCSVRAEEPALPSDTPVFSPCIPNTLVTEYVVDNSVPAHLDNYSLIEPAEEKEKVRAMTEHDKYFAMSNNDNYFKDTTNFNFATLNCEIGSLVEEVCDVQGEMKYSEIINSVRKDHNAEATDEILLSLHVLFMEQSNKESDIVESDINDASCHVLPPKMESCGTSYFDRTKHVTEYDLLRAMNPSSLNLLCFDSLEDATGFITTSLPDNNEGLLCLDDKISNIDISRCKQQENNVHNENSGNMSNPKKGELSSSSFEMPHKLNNLLSSLFIYEHKLCPGSISSKSKSDESLNSNNVTLSTYSTRNLPESPKTCSLPVEPIGGEPSTCDVIQIATNLEDLSGSVLDKIEGKINRGDEPLGAPASLCVKTNNEALTSSVEETEEEEGTAHKSVHLLEEAKARDGHEVRLGTSAYVP